MKQRFEDSLYSGQIGVDVLTAQTQTSHYLVVALYISALQVIQHTPPLRDHLKQAAPRVIILLMNLEMFGKLVNSLT